MKRVVDFLFEVGMLKRTPRSGWQFLGSGEESVADHSFRTAMIAFTLAKLDDAVDLSKTLQIALVHDLPEARTGDLNYMNQKYVTANEEAAASDMAHGLPFGDELLSLLVEYHDQETAESVLVRDADQLDFLLELKTQIDKGNQSAEDWIPFVVRRLKTANARTIAQQIIDADSSDWWFDRGSEWWVNGGKG
ncbi:MAG: HD domain-containing protein [bacterium]|nr:HD domain-containing protein [bacterium]